MFEFQKCTVKPVKPTFCRTAHHTTHTISRVHLHIPNNSTSLTPSTEGISISSKESNRVITRTISTNNRSTFTIPHTCHFLEGKIERLGKYI